MDTQRKYAIVEDGGVTIARQGVYCVGNGRVIAYGRGAEWTEAVGPVYSAPRAFSMRFAGEAEAWETARAEGSSAWTHRRPGGVIADGASREYGCLIRSFETEGETAFALRFGDNKVRDNSFLFPGAGAAYLIEIPAGAPVYNWYPTRDRMYMELILRGGASMEDGRLTMRGRGDMLLVGAGDYPGLIEAARRACGTDGKEIWASIDREDREAEDRRKRRAAPLREHPLKGAVMRAADDTAMLIRAQQGREGGVMAGYNYHLGYVRDQYGVYRGLMALGMWEEARAILGFYRDVHERYGKIANAQSMGNGGIFHVHEYDGSEITGYIAILCAHYLRATGDEAFFTTLLPLIRWAIGAQLPLLQGGMMPFNGDETYIAGGVLPRDCIPCGALEATYLFVAGVEACVPLVRKYAGEEPWMKAAEAAAREARSRFRANFWRANGYVCDSLGRLEGLHAPAFRHGVCNRCGAFGWTHRVGDCWYVCPECLKDARDESAPKEYKLASVITTAVYTDCGVMEEAYLREETQALLSAYRRTGKLPSRPDGERSLGYDYGMLLYAAGRYGMEADDLLRRMLDIRDDTGAWVEYYDGDVPTGTFCRPWESAINAEAALYYLSAK